MLRNPGQSLEQRIDRVINDDFMGYFILPASLWLIAILEWFAKLTPDRSDGREAKVGKIVA